MKQEAKGAPEWPAELDALTAAPKHHRRVFENARVRVLEVRIGPGETVPLHTHRWPSVNFEMSGSHFVRRDGNGNVLRDTRREKPAAEFPATLWSEPLAPHSVENVGAEEIRMFSVELKDATG